MKSIERGFLSKIKEYHSTLHSAFSQYIDECGLQ